MSNKLILQYAFRYGTVILVTMVLVMLLVSRVMGAYKNIFVERVREELHLAVQELDAALLGQYELAKEIAISSKASGSYITQSQLTGMEGIRQLETYRKMIADTCDYLFVSYNSRDLYSNTGFATVQAYLRGALNLDEDSAGILEEVVVNQQHGINVLENSDGGHVLVGVYPVNHVLEKTRAVVGFAVEDDTLEGFFCKRFEQEPLYAVMSGPVGEFLFALNHLGDISEERLEWLHRELLSSGEKEIPGYAIDRYESESGYVFYFAVPEDYIFYGFNRMLYSVLMWGIVVFAVVLLLIMGVNSIHVRQIRKVRDVLLEYQSGSQGNGRQNEIEQIHSLISNLCKRHLESEASRRQMHRGVSGYMARLLFEGHIQQEELLEGLANQLTPRLSGGYYAAFSIFTNAQELVTRDEEADLSERIFSEEEFPVCVADTFNGITRISFVAVLPDGDKSGVGRLEIAGRLLKRISGDNLKSVVVVGKVYGELRNIYKSYDEMLSLAYSVLDKEDWGGENVFVFEIALKVRKHCGTLGKNICLLQHAVRDGSFEEISHALEAVMADILKESELLAQKYSFYVLIQTICELMEELDIEQAQLDKVLRLSFADPKALEQNLIRILRSVRAETDCSMDVIMLFINENFRDSTMGLDTLAERFHLSVSAVSKRIKEQTGVNYTEHVSRLRMEEACRLLEQTDLSIQEITYQVGYSDYGSFSKKFKACKGITPGEYRKSCHYF